MAKFTWVLIYAGLAVGGFCLGASDKVFIGIIVVGLIGGVIADKIDTRNKVSDSLGLKVRSFAENEESANAWTQRKNL